MFSRFLIFCSQVPLFAGPLAVSSAQVIVTGVVTGHDGKPMPAPQVQLANAANESVATTTAKADGSFEIRASDPGLLKKICPTRRGCPPLAGRT